MHVMALKKNLAERHPGLPGELFRVFSKSKHWAQRWRRAIPSLVEAWPNQTLDEERKVFETDPWAYGLEANRHTLNKFLRYCDAQGISTRKIAPEELFHSSTVSLTE
jgi:4,5-dihydroxyphthalate decarboxylase